MNRPTILVSIISLLVLLVSISYHLFFNQPNIIQANTADPEKLFQIADITSYEVIELLDLKDQPTKLSQWEKPIHIINFWAPWCAPCRREIPGLVDLQNQYKDQVQVIGLSYDSKENVINFIEKYPINYPLLLVGNKATGLSRFFGNKTAGLPFTAILNQQRDIVFKHTGEISREQLETQIKPYL